jgi:hypothetical protein
MALRCLGRCCDVVFLSPAAGRTTHASQTSPSPNRAEASRPARGSHPIGREESLSPALQEVESGRRPAEPLRSVRSRRERLGRRDGKRLPSEATPSEVAKKRQYDESDDDPKEPGHLSPSVGGWRLYSPSARLWNLGFTQLSGSGSPGRRLDRGEANTKIADRHLEVPGGCWLRAGACALETLLRPCRWQYNCLNGQQVYPPGLRPTCAAHLHS